MGPECKHCGAIYEWTEGEINEQFFAPQVYFCSECYELSVFTVSELKRAQRQANEYFSQFDNCRTETEEDWKNLRHNWDNGNIR